MKILIIRLSAIGDTVHSLPAAAEIKARLPDVEITWLVEPDSAPLLINNPMVDQVLVVNRKVWLGNLFKPWQWLKSITEARALLQTLRSAHYDAVVDLQGLMKSAIWTALSNCQLRVGFRGAREGSAWFLTDKVDVGDLFCPEKHVVDQNLMLADHLCRRLSAQARQEGKMQDEDRCLVAAQFPLPPGQLSSLNLDEQWSTIETGDRNISMVPTVVLIPGTTWSSKIWPGENWASLGRLLSQELSLKICLVGSQSEMSANAKISNWLKAEAPSAVVLDLTGKTNLIDLIAVFEKAYLVVGADTGPLHLAAATGKPKVVGIYGSTPVKRNGPYGTQCQAVSLGLWCQPCFEKTCPLSTTACLNDLEPRLVFAAIKKFMDL